MAITLRYTATDTSGKTSELSYQEMNNNLKSYYYSSSLSNNVLDLHFLSGSTSHSIDLSGLSDTVTNIYNTDSSLTAARTVTADSNNLTFDMTTAFFTINTDPAQRVIINGLNTGDNAQVLGIDSNGVIKAMSTSSIAGGGTPGGSDTQVQYNNGGSFGGSAIYFDDANNSVGINVAPYSNRALAVSSSAGIAMRLQSEQATANRIQFFNASSVGAGAVAGTINGDDFHIQQSDTALTTNLYISSSGETYLPRITAASKANVVGYDSATGELTYYSTASFGGGSASPGGSDTYVQFNDGGSTFGGDSGLTYNKTTNKLTITAPSSPSRTAPNLLLNSELANVTAGEVFGVIAANNATDQYNPANYPASIQFTADTNFAPGNYDARIGLFVNNNATETEALRLKSSGQASLPQYGAGSFTGTNAYYLAVSASGEVIETAPPGGFTRPGSDTSITYDTYLQTVNTYSVNAVGTNPSAPSSNGDVSIRYAVSNIGSNVDRIDVYDSDGTDRSATLLNLAISGSITLLQVGAGGHTEVYRIISVTDNGSYVSYAVSWVSGDDAAISTITTDTFTFNADYEYELSTGYNRLLVTNNSNSSANQLRFAPPAGASAGDEVIVELKVNTGSVNVRPTYLVRNGTPTFQVARRVSEINGSTVSAIELDTNDVAIMKFQVNDIGSVEGLMLLGAAQMVYA